METLKFLKFKFTTPTTSKPSKKDAAITGGGFLRFQIGLIVALGVSYFLMESVFAISEPEEPVTKAILEDEKVYVMPEFIVEKVKKVTTVNKQPQKAVVTDEVKVVDNDTKVEAKDEFLNKPEPKVEVDVDDIEYVDVKKELDPVSVTNVEFVPVFPGCETLSDNAERRECLSDHISKIIQKNFDASIASDYGLSGRLRIDVQFKINNKGRVTDVKVRAPHKSLEKEARRVAGLIPQMEPGRQGATPVDVIFLKPIIFQVQ